MGQKVHPYGFRIGFNKTWTSRWFADKEYANLLHEDLKLKRDLKKRFQHAGVAKVEIERAANKLKIDIHTSRPGIIIGRKGQEVDRLKMELENLTGRHIDLKIVEVNQPNRNAALVAQDIAQQLAKRGSFRRTIKRSLEQVMEAGVYGIKVQVSGRLGGAEMSRTEKANKGSVPLSTLRRNIDYGFAISKTKVGVIGVKVWIDLGDYSEENSDGADASKSQASKKPKRTYKR